MKYGYWLVVGSQPLRDQNVLKSVAAQSKEMAMVLNGGLLHSFILKVTAKINPEITAMVIMSPDDDMNARVMVRAA